MQPTRGIKLQLVPSAKRRKIWLESKYRNPNACLSADEPNDYVISEQDGSVEDEPKRKIRRTSQPNSSRQGLQKSIQDILSAPPPETITSSLLWKTISEAKGNDPSAPFLPMPLEHQATLEVSLVINLYDNGFSFDEQDVSYQYSRANASVADTVNLGILPGQLDQILQRADRFMKEGHQAQRPEKQDKHDDGSRTDADKDKDDKPDPEAHVKEEKPDASRAGVPQGGGTVTNVPTPITFYEGGIVIEVRDYREGRSTVSSSSSSLKPTTFKMYLKPDMHSLLYHLDSLHLTPKARLQIEQNLLNRIHPAVCLDPSFDVHAISTSMYYNINKFNIPTKTKSARRKHRVVTTRQSVAPHPVSAAPISVFASPDELSMNVSRGKMPLLSFLHQVHHSSFAQETLQQQQMRPASSSEKATSSNSRHSSVDPRPKVAMEPQPPIVGKHYFSHFVPAPAPPPQPHSQQAPPQQQRPQFTTEFITLEIKSSGGPPSELYHATVRPSLTAKPLQVTLGGPSMAQQFFHQFRKLENAATPDQIKYLQTLQQQQQQRAQQQAQQAQPSPVASTPGNQQPTQSASTSQPVASAPAARPAGSTGPVSVTMKREGEGGVTTHSKPPVVAGLPLSAAAGPQGLGRGTPPQAVLPPVSGVKAMQQLKYPATTPKVPQGPQIAALQTKPPLVPQSTVPGAPKQPSLSVAQTSAPLNPALFKSMGPGAPPKPIPGLPIPSIPNQTANSVGPVNPVSPGVAAQGAPQTPPSASRPNTRQSSAKKK